MTRFEILLKELEVVLAKVSHVQPQREELSSDQLDVLWEIQNLVDGNLYPPEDS